MNFYIQPIIKITNLKADCKSPPLSSSDSTNRKTEYSTQRHKDTKKDEKTLPRGPRKTTQIFSVGAHGCAPILSFPQAVSGNPFICSRDLCRIRVHSWLQLSPSPAALRTGADSFVVGSACRRRKGRGPELPDLPGHFGNHSLCLRTARPARPAFLHVTLHKFLHDRL